MITRATIGHAIPTVLTFAVLIAVGWWGHHTGWALTRPHSGPVDPHSEDWCAEHGVHESECLLCKKSLMKAQKGKEPAAQVAKDEEIRFAQVASVEVATKAGITTLATTATTLEPTVTTPAETIYEPTRVARITTRVPGVVRQVTKRLGDVVAAGEIIAVMESADIGRLKSDLMRALAEQAAARATSERLRAAAEGGFRTAGDAREALGRLQAAQIAVFDAEQALLNLGMPVSAAELADLDPAALGSRLRSLGLPEGTASTSANLLAITSPQAGVVTELTVTIGEALETGARVAVVADTARLWLALAASPADAVRVKPGQRLQFIAGEVIASGTITVVAPAADDATRLVPVYAQLDNTTNALRVHQVGSATISLGDPKPVVIIPAGAVQYDGPTAYVFVQRTPTIFRGLPVRVLGTTPDGLAVDRVIPGDVVAVTGTDVLKGNLFQDKFGPGCACGGEK